MKKGVFFGIDFGTTNTSVICVINDEHGSKKITLGEEGSYPFSSIVAIPKDEGQMLFGREVKRRRLELSDNYTIIPSMKPKLGTNEEYIINGKRYTPTDITAAFLQHIVNYISKNYDYIIEEATFALPVDFSPDARRELRKAAKNAGIRIKGFVNEPTAAYVSCKDDVKAFSKVMVIDWGGGTLDINVLNLKENKIHENSVYGINYGGDDIDELLAQRVHSKLVNQTNINVNYEKMLPSEKDNIRSQCELAKVDLSTFDDCDIVLRNYGQFGTKTLSIDSNYLEGLLMPIIKDTILKAINTAMERAKTTKEGIDLVIIVGGSSGLRPYANAITNIFGSEKIIRPEDYQWSVAKGAAYMDIIGSKHVLNDDVGVLLSDGTIYRLFEKDKNMVGDSIQQLSFSLTEDSQDAHFIFTNEDNSVKYGQVNIKTKGFLNERLKLDAEIDNNQIVKININNLFMGHNYNKKTELKMLKFYYDLSEVSDI